MSPRFKHKLQSMVLACSTAFGAFIAAQPAHAAYVVVDVDPAFGVDYPDLGWRAKGALYIPDSCKSAADLTTGRFQAQRDIWGVCSGAQLQDVKVEFYDLADLSKTTVETLMIGTYQESSTPYYYAPLPQELLDLTFDDGLLTGFHTSMSNWVRAFSSIAGNGGDEFSLVVGLDEPAFERGSMAADVSTNSSATTLYSRGDGTSSSSSSETVSVGPYLSDAEYLPEPGSLVLAATALGASLLAGASARKRKQG